MTLKIIDDHRLRPQNNDLTLVRLLLASLVIYSHGFFAVRGDDHDDLANLLGAPISNYAVDGFFILSGFLVYRSIVTNNSLRFFALARFARLWPALAVMVVLVVLGGLLYTSLEPISYLCGVDTLKFVTFNPSFVFAKFTLSGVTCGKELCNVNGSLWTLPWEARCYLLLALLGFLRLARARAMTWFLLPATFAFACLWDIGVASGVNLRLGSGMNYQFERLDRLWVAFSIGIACYLFRRRIGLSWWICLLLFAANIAVQQLAPAAGLHTRQLFMAYFVLCLGFLGLSEGAVSSRWPDYSYGMYIYAFPIMFVLQREFGFRSPYLLAIANLACTIPFAAASWHLVEKPVLDRLKHYRKSMAKSREHPVPVRPDPVAPGGA